MLEELAIGRGDGRLARPMNAWSRAEVLMLDDFLIRPISPDAASDTLEVIEDRHGLRSTILTSLSFMDRANGLIITGPTGVGKTYLGCALGMEAIRQEYSVRYVRTSDLIERLTLARADGSYRSLMANLRRLDLLILDDFGLSPVSVSSSRELLEIIDARVDLRSTIFLSQFPVAQFHALMEDKTAADAIMDRIIHASRVIELTGESMRKLKARDEPNQDEEGG